jgi:RHS repeat-associated protein
MWKYLFYNWQRANAEQRRCVTDFDWLYRAVVTVLVSLCVVLFLIWIAADIYTFQPGWLGKDPGTRAQQVIGSLSDAEKGFVNRIRQTVSDGGDLNASMDVNGQTLLHIAAARGFNEAVRLLLDNGADFNIRDAEGKRPIQRAFEAHQTDTLMLLYQYGDSLLLERPKGSQWNSPSSRVYLYDKALRLQYVSQPFLGLTQPWIAKLSYDQNGNRDSLTYYREGTFEGDTTSIGYTYNRDNRLTAYSTTGGLTFNLSNTTIDGLGRLAAATETLTDTLGATKSHDLAYSYDMRSQLIIASVSNIGGSTWSADYEYDKAGNVTSQTVNSTPTSFAYDGDLMTAKGVDSVDWDLNGQMTTGITASMMWTWDGKLQSASAGGSNIALKYVPGFDRVYKESTVNQTTTKSKYIVDPTGGLSLILLEINPDENDPNTSIRKTYVYANSHVIAQHDGFYADDIYFYLHDRLGSVRQVIDTEANVENKYVYRPFGESFASEQAETISNAFKFTGQFFDSEIEQYYLRARQYDPAVHRFASHDPYEGTFESPLELHRYLYCQNDPLNAVDPSGRLLTMALRAKEAEVKVGIAAAVTATLAYYVYARNFAFNISISAIEFDLDSMLAVGMSLV